MAKLLLVSYHFPPSTAVGALRPGRWARLLPELGYEVRAVCAPAGHGEGQEDPSRARLVPKGVPVVSVDSPYILGRNPFSPPGRNQRLANAIWKAKAYVERLFFTADWSWKWGVAARDTVTSLLEEDVPDIAVLDAPPHVAIVPVARLLRERGVPFVLDLRDFWGCDDSGLRYGVLSPGVRRGRWEASLRKETIQAASQVVLTTPQMAEHTRRLFPDLPPSRFSCVTNAFDEADLHPLLPVAEDGGEGTKVKLIHAGTLEYGRSRQAEKLVEALGRLKRSVGGPVEAHFLGRGGGGLLELAAREGVADAVKVTGWVEKGRAEEIQREAHGLLLLQPAELVETQVAVPGKLFDYMASRRNIFALVGEGPAADIVEEEKLGIAVKTNDPSEIAEGLRRLVGIIQERPTLPPPSSRYSAKVTAEDFARVLRRVLEGPED